MKETSMTQAKIEPGVHTISPAGKPTSPKAPQDESAEKDLAPELGLRSPLKKKKPSNAGPLDPGVKLGD
jgi:hypothetical protein